MRRKRKSPNLIKYILISLLVFISAIFVSIIARMFLVADVTFFMFSSEQAGLVTSMIEGVVGAIAASLVLYQLKISSNVEEKQNNIEEAQFILKYNQSFIQDANMSNVEHLLECSMLHKVDSPIITDENRQLFINYLVYLESLSPLVLGEVLQLDHIDDLFAYRFFLAMNNRELQKDQLFTFPDYYRGCFKLYERWKKYRKQTHKEILMENNSLDKWAEYEKYIESPVEVRRIKKTDNLKTVAELIYETDKYIYPAAFGSKRIARQVIPALMCRTESIFDMENIFVAIIDEHIVGVAVVLNSVPKKIDSKKTLKDFHSLPKSFGHACEQYFNKMDTHFTEDEMGYIACISVGTKWRGQRVGEIIIKHIIQVFAGKKLMLHVLCENQRAICLYKKYGFKYSGLTQEGYAYHAVPPCCYEMIYDPGIEYDSTIQFGIDV